MDEIDRAFFLGSLPDALRLLDGGLNVDSANEFGNTLLIRRCLGPAHSDEDGAILNLLLKRGAEVGRQNNHGNTALLYAAGRHNVDYVSRLIRAGANINHQNDEGITPLMAAVGSANEEVITLLLDAGADRNIANLQGRTILDVARSFTSQYWHPEDELSEAVQEEWEKHHEMVREHLVALLSR